LIKVTSNSDQVFKELGGKLLDLESAIGLNKIIRIAALDAVAIISDRVQQRGEKTDGTPIGGNKNHVAAHRNFKTGKVFSKRKKTTSRVIVSTPYSEDYAIQRIKKGRQVDHVDLTFTGDMLDNFTASPSGENGYEVGFRGQKSADKSKYLEVYFGEIFSLSPSEADLSLNKIQTAVNAVLR
jgi:hypothetical protein